MPIRHTPELLKSLADRISASLIEVNDEFYVIRSGISLKLIAINISINTQKIMAKIISSNNSVIWSQGKIIPVFFSEFVFIFDKSPSEPEAPFKSIPKLSSQPIDPNIIPASSHKKGASIKIVDLKSKYSDPPNLLFEVVEVTASGPVKIKPFPVKESDQLIIINGQTKTKIAKDFSTQKT